MIPNPTPMLTTPATKALNFSFKRSLQTHEHNAEPTVSGGEGIEKAGLYYLPALVRSPHQGLPSLHKAIQPVSMLFTRDGCCSHSCSCSGRSHSCRGCSCRGCSCRGCSYSCPEPLPGLKQQ